MQKITKKNKCCGCHACANICPRQAISMENDKRGFKYPIIDQRKCVNCNLCKKVCPILNTKEEKHEIETYACYNKNTMERINSSSGGIFILLAKQIIKRNGVVFGASFDEDFQVHHDYVEKEVDLKKIMGSKYIQSTIGDTYKKVKFFLDNDKYVLFTGTPCQIEGLKFFLKKDYDRLYTQDVVCHGVPSPKVFKKYIDFQKVRFNDDIKNISFRNKDDGWSSYRTKIVFKNNVYSEFASNDIYSKLFLSNICLRESCYNCSFKKIYRLSDITLADYWGIDNISPKMNDGKGTSLIIINTDKGRELLNLIDDDIQIVETNIYDAIKYNPSIIKSSKKHVNFRLFNKNLDNMDIDALLKKYIINISFYKKIFIIVNNKTNIIKEKLFHQKERRN